MTPRCLLLLLFCSALSPAQEPVPTGKPIQPQAPSVKPATPAKSLGVGRFSGFVLDDDGKVLPGADVTIIDALSTRKTIRTGTDGSFSFPKLAPGEYRLEWGKRGFWLSQHDLMLYSDDPGYILMRGGPVPLLPAVARHQYEVEERVLAGETETKKWLDDQLKRDLVLVGITPLQEKASLFVFDKRPAASREYFVLPVLDAPTRDAIQERVRSQSRLLFLGIHRLNTNAFLIVFRNE